MIPSQQKRRLLALAETFAGELAGSEVHRSEWRHVADALYLGPGTPRERRAGAEKLIDALPDSWVRNRSAKTAQQLRQVRATFRRLLDERLPDEELRYVVGWTTRFLYLRGARR